MRRNRPQSGLLGMLGIMLLGATPAQAVPQVFTDLATWQAAVSGIATENFDTAQDLVAGSNDIGLFNIFLPNDPDNDNSISGGALDADIDNDEVLGPSFIRFDFDAPVFGFGGDFQSTISGGHLTVEVNGTVIQFDSVPGFFGSGFLGVIDTTAFTSITFDEEDARPNFDEVFQITTFRLASGLAGAQAVPAPGTLALLGAGLAGLGLLARRRKAA